MRLDKAVIFEVPGADPSIDRVVRDSPGGRMTIVAVPTAEAIADVAVQLVEIGVKLIELCGGISPLWRAVVSDAVGDRAAVSSATFGIESLPAAARYNAAFEKGETTSQAFILLEPGAAGMADRFVMVPVALPTTMIPVPDEGTAAVVAAELAAEGVQLIELYGGFSTAGIGKILGAVAGRAAVGAGSLAIDGIRNLQAS